MVRIAMYDYTKPATESGLSPAFRNWEEPEEKWTTYNPERAIEYFEKAGYVYKDQQMLDQDGNQLHFDIAVVFSQGQGQIRRHISRATITTTTLTTRITGKLTTTFIDDDY